MLMQATPTLQHNDLCFQAQLMPVLSKRMDGKSSCRCCCQSVNMQAARRCLIVPTLCKAVVLMLVPE